MHGRYHAAAFVLLVVVFLVALPFRAASGSVQESSRPDTQLSRVQRSLQSAPNILFVALLNGKLVAIDADSGRSLWTFDSGAPLISSQKSELMDADIFLDGTDGGLYVYRSLSGTDPALERLPITLPELVEAAPSLAEDGSLLLGTRRSTVYLLDTATGHLLSTFSDSQSSLEDRSTFSLHERVASGQLLIIGRQDYTVRSQKVTTGQDHWNATFSRLHLLNAAAPRGKGAALQAFLRGADPEELEAIAGAPPPASASAAPRATLPTPSTGPAPSALPRLAAGIDNSLHAFDPAPDGFQRWRILFESPPIGAYSARTGSTNFLKPPGPSAPPTPAGHPSALAGATVVVGRLPGGSSYALKAEHLVLDAAPPALPAPYEPPSDPSDPTNSSSSDPSDSDSDPDAPRRAPSPAGHSATAVRAAPSRPAVDPTTNPAHPSLREYVTRRGGSIDMVNNLVCPVGVHPVQTPSTDDHPPFIPAPRSNPPRRHDPSPPAHNHPSVSIADHPHAEELAHRLQFQLQVMYALFASVALVVLSSAVWYYVSRITAPQPAPANPSADLVAAAEAILAHHQATLLNQPAPLSTPLPRYPSDPASYSNHSHHSDQSAAGTAPSPAASPTALGAPATPPLPAVLPRKVDSEGAVLVGRLRVGPSVLGYGSAGTVVYDGRLDGRPVAVKRMLRQFYEIARKEIGLLIKSDEHPNVVRCFAMEEDEEFVYLALERCRSALAELVSEPQGRALLVGPCGRMAATCQVIMHDIACGLGALHDRGIVHRDLKPHNVLLTDSGRAKLSDMGLSKQLGAEQSSFESHGAGGSSGWQAPEQLMAKGAGGNGIPRQTRAMDVFSLGCVLYYCITGGKHPFGETYERDTNIMRGAPNLVPLAPYPEAANLISTMLKKDAAARPTMTAVLAHPLWWAPERRLQFLLDISDRVEGEDREPDQTLLEALEAWGPAAIGSNWGSAMDPELIANIGKYRRYDYTSLRDLLRVVRNKRNHFRELPEALRERMGALPEAYLAYFCGRFPRLLLAMFFFAAERLADDPALARYWASDPVSFRPCHVVFVAYVRALLAQAPAAGRGGGGRGSAGCIPPLPAAAPAPALEREASGSSSGGASNDAGSSSGGGVSRRSTPQEPLQLPPAANGSPAPSAAAVGAQVVGWEVEEELPELTFREFPKRPGKQLCDFFAKTGHCKFGDDCIFDHPDKYAVGLTLRGFPYRPGNQLCPFYLKNNHCKFGPACKFHHPPLRPILAGSAVTEEPAAAPAPATGAPAPTGGEEDPAASAS